MTFNSKNPSAYETLITRRSVKAATMAEPAPDRDTLRKIIAAGLRVPDHGKLAPWRFIVLEGHERGKLGRLIRTALIEENGTHARTAEKMQNYATLGPCLIVAIFSPSSVKPIPEWEQQLSMGAACQNMLVAATALGYAGQWLTGWASYSPTVAKGLGLEGNERIAGLLFFGSHDKTPTERDRPELDDHVIWGFPR